MKELNLILIGCGPHAKRIYIPILKKLGNSHKVKISCVVDLISKRPEITIYFQQLNVPMQFIFLNPNEQQMDKLLPSTQKKLNYIVKDLGISGVIIATEPLAHKAYASWALQNGLNILMDKPITTRPNSMLEEKQAMMIESDYHDLVSELKLSRQAYPLLIFNIMAQRRYHPAFMLIRKLINEASIKTNCPITFIQAFHGDGQWRTPSELIDVQYHSFNKGFGKCSHSGYHTIDAVNLFIKSANVTPDKKASDIEVFTNIVTPPDFVSQITTEDYRRIFMDYDKYSNYNEIELLEKTRNYGEIDAFTLIAFKSLGNTITSVSLNMSHNSFSQRFLPFSNKDLYKGNGRVRHECYLICQGPFQTIIFSSYQGKEINDELKNPYEIGGEYHLDIDVFRNDKLFPEWDNHRHYSSKNLMRPILNGYSRGHQEDARYQCIVEFINQIRGKISHSLSGLEDHQDNVKIMSAIYQSAARRHNLNQNPLVTMKLHQ